MQKLLNIKVCIWDFDGTLYRSTPAMIQNIRASEIRVICEHTGWSVEKASEEFYKLFKIVTPSGTHVVSMLTGITNKEATVETSKRSLYKEHLQKDEKLQPMFDTLKHFSHYMLVNGSQESVARGLSVLGVSPKIFKEVVTSEIVGETKPSSKGFEYIMKKTGLPADQHLMIGDREDVDLAPAKALGMQTCLVWDPMPVYDIVNIV